MDFANTESARNIIDRLYPDAKSVKFIEHGYDNLVGLVDEEAAFKFPRNEYSYIRDKYEKLVLSDLASLNGIAIPKVIGEGDNPPYLVISFVPGECLGAEEIDRMPQDKQKEFGESLAQFAFSMHSLLSIEKALDDKRKVGMNDFDFYDDSLSTFHFPNPVQDRIAQDYYKNWKNLDYSTPKVVVHNDLNTMNLLFDKGSLVGVIDFGDTQVGTPEQELRQLYRINNFVLQASVDHYEKLSGYKLNVEAIKVWAVIQELAAYASKLASSNLTHPGFITARKHLQKWLPEGNWE